MIRIAHLIKRVCNAIDNAVEWGITILFSLMVVIGGLQVVSRYLLKQSLSWSEESQKYLHIWMIFLAIPLAYKRGAHLGMNIVVDKLPLGAQQAMFVAYDLMWLGLGTAMVVYTSPLMTVASRQTSPGLGLRMDLVYSCMAIGGSYLVFTALRKLADHIRNFLRNSSREDTA